MEKRGLSDVVTTVLIILLVLAAVVIIWSFVRPAIQSGAGKVSAGCVELSLSASSCTASTGVVTVSRDADSASLKELVLVYELSDGTTKRIDTGKGATDLPGLGQVVYTPTLGSGANQLDILSGKTLKFVTPTAQITTEAGEIQLCSPTAIKKPCT